MKENTKPPNCQLTGSGKIVAKHIPKIKTNVMKMTGYLFSIKKDYNITQI